MKALKWPVYSFLGWYQYENWSWEVQERPANWQHGREILNLNPVCWRSVTAWTMEKTVEELEQARKRLILWSQPKTHDFEGIDGKIGFVQAPVPARNA